LCFFLKIKIMDNDRSQNKKILEMNGQGMNSHQLTLSLVVTHARKDPPQRAVINQDIPTCPDTSLPWSEDATHGGWSARMFLHQMLSHSNSAWKPSDTQRLLSNSTVKILRLRVAGGSSLSEILNIPLKELKKRFITQRALAGIIKRHVRREKPLRLVLLPTRYGIQRVTILCTNQEGDYVFSLRKNEKPSRDSPEAGLLTLLSTAVGSCSETQ